MENNHPTIDSLPPLHTQSFKLGESHTIKQRSELELSLDKLDVITENYVNDTYRRKEDNYTLYKKERKTLLLDIKNWIKNTCLEEINLNSTSKKGNTLLHHIIEAAADEAKDGEQSDMFNFTQYLLEHKANPDLQNNEGKTAFFHCMCNCLKRLPKVYNLYKPTSLKILSNLLYLFLDAKADPNVSSRNNDFMCILGDREYSEDVKQILQRTNIKDLMNNKDHNGHTPACHAAWILNLDLLHFLDKVGADFNIQDTQGKTPLMHALECKNGWMEHIFGTEQIDTVIKFLQERSK